MVAETGDTLIDTLWAEEPTAEQAAALCQSVQRPVRTRWARPSSSARMDQAPATLGSDGDPLVASAFVDSSSTSSAFLVRAGGTPDAPTADHGVGQGRGSARGELPETP